MTSYLPHRRGRYARAYQWVDGELLVMVPPETIDDPKLHNQYVVEIVGSGVRLGTIVRPYGARPADRLWSAFPVIAEGSVWAGNPYVGCQFRTRREAIVWLFAGARVS